MFPFGAKFVSLILRSFHMLFGVHKYRKQAYIICKSAKKKQNEETMFEKEINKRKGITAKWNTNTNKRYSTYLEAKKRTYFFDWDLLFFCMKPIVKPFLRKKRPLSSVKCSCTKNTKGYHTFMTFLHFIVGSWLTWAVFIIAPMLSFGAIMPENAR